MMSALSIFRRFTPARSPRRDWVAASDAEVALAAREQGREGKEAFVEIVRRHQTAVCAVAFSVSGRMAMTDDIAQEAFLRAWKRIATLREPAKLKAWLARIAHDCAVDALRREKPHASLDDVEAVHQLAATDPPPDKMAADADDERLVWSALAELPENVRTPLVLFYREGQSVAAVAAALDLSEDAVRQRLSRGRNALRDHVAEKIEGVLGRVKPNPLLVVTVAGAIGLAAAPGAVAAASVSGKAAGSSATSASLTASHYLAAAAALAVCLPLGWKVRESVRKTTAAAPSAATAATDPLAEFADSDLLREWRRLHEVHGKDASAMPVIYDAIQNVPREFHQHALRRALLTEWAGVDPGGGFDFLRAKRQTAHATVLSREWMRRDPQNAAEWFALQAPDASGIVCDLLSEVAEKIPDKLAAIVAALAMPDGSGNKEIAAAFTLFAAKNPDAARAAAETITGPQREPSLAGVAAGWAQRDGAAAYAWSKSLPKGAAQDAAVRAAITAWAGSDPAPALAHFEDLPSDMRNDPAEEVMQAAVERDFPVVLEWLSTNSDKITSSGVWDKLAGPLMSRFRDGQEAFLEWLGSQEDRLRKGLFMALCREAVDTAEHRDRLWKWLETQPRNYTLGEMRGWLIGSVAGNEPKLAVDWMKQLPNESWSRWIISTRIDAMFLRNFPAEENETRAALLERLITGFPPALQPGLYHATLEATTDWDEAALATWRQRIAETPDEVLNITASDAAKSICSVNPEAAMAWALSLPNRQARESALGRATIRWAETDPAAASEWALSLPAGKAREAALGAVAGTWAETDSAAASEWVNELPRGPQRDRAAAALVSGIAETQPDAAWAWALSITDKRQRDDAFLSALVGVYKKNPERGRQLAQSPEISEDLRKSFYRGYAGEPDE